MTLPELNAKHALYITTRHSDALNREIVYFDSQKLLKDRGALIFEPKMIPAVRNMELFKKLSEEIAEWHRLQGRVEYAKKKELEDYQETANTL